MNGPSNNTSLSVSSSVAAQQQSSSNNSTTTTIAPCSSSSSSSSSSQGSTHHSSALAVNASAAASNSNNLSVNGSGSTSLGITQPPMPFDYQQQFYAPFQGSQFGGQQSLYSPHNQLDSLVYDKLRLLSNQSQGGGASGTNFYAHNTNGSGFKLLPTQKPCTSPSLQSDSTVAPASTSPRSLWSQKLPCNNHWYQNPSSGGNGEGIPPSGMNFQHNLGLSAITGASLPNGSSPSPGNAFNSSGFNYPRIGFSSSPAAAIAATTEQSQHAAQQQDTPPPPSHDSVKKG